MLEFIISSVIILILIRTIYQLKKELEYQEEIQISIQQIRKAQERMMCDKCWDKHLKIIDKAMHRTMHRSCT